jgi:hypothetical protein
MEEGDKYCIKKVLGLSFGITKRIEQEWFSIFLLFGVIKKP